MRFRSTILFAPIAVLNVAVAQTASTEAMTRLNVVLPRAAEEQLALSAAPEHLRAAATVYVYGERGYERIRAGSNGFTCLVNRDAFLYGAWAFKPTCWDIQGEKTYLPVMLKVGSMLAARESSQAIQAAIDTGFANRTFRAPEIGGVAYMLAGDVEVDPATGRVTRQLFPGHYMFYALGATNDQLGFTAEAAKRDPTIPSVFAGGAGGRHGLSYVIAVPGHAHPP
jgi:hypothetical protein